MKNQLFRRNPDRYIINDLMSIFNIKSLDDKNFHFTKLDFYYYLFCFQLINACITY